MKLQEDKLKYTELRELGNLSVEDLCENNDCQLEATVAQIASRTSDNSYVYWCIWFFCDDCGDKVDKNSGIVQDSY